MPASPSTARAINDRLALRLLQQEGPLTAGQLKTLTGLSRPSVADLVERLQESGLVRVVGEAGEQRRGPNARLYGIAADRAHLAALDVRTQGLTVVVADLVGATLAEATLPIGSDTGTEPAVEQAVALLEGTAREAGVTRLHRVGIGAPGLIDPVTGELRDSTELPAWHRSLVAALQQRLPGTVLVENETNLAAVAEQRLGAARGLDDFVLLWLGQGVGAAVVLGGALRRGASGGAGEIGFLPVPGTGGLPSATRCDAGFHALAGAAAVRRLALLHGVGGEAEEAVRAAAVGERPGGRGDAFLDALAGQLAVGAAAVAAVLDPGCVVLGGEIGYAGGAALAARVEARLAALSPLRTGIRPTELGGEAVLRGALLAARDAAQAELFAPAP
ncbi:ROK family transcriptional regulator [Streptomyces tirandamycinicus]|uniref:ROK family transcriptional regulator n=1 Tax=Streptomyces tirandamycinicus TaxID=2174846 RepID=A0A2S1SSD6_9ACTN|nr:ROK family transcriptional regulator [Streptomyces tirandamycinicus]AWI29298.1 ROK family transcriptional regulator [Streptomyces tirandamycinicus]